ncbi:splicing factor 3B subunit 2-like [Haliotis cracherodii]|uniref:splicing factor 3B subunit 2-like n=1 Tax=Haliotis cracherodii TaxID=6455 RepID=UPI0039E91244
MAGMDDMDDLPEDEMEDEMNVGRFDDDLQRKVMLQQQMLEAERQKDATMMVFAPPPGVPQPMQQQMQGVPPGMPQGMPPTGPPPVPQQIAPPMPPQMPQGGPQGLPPVPQPMGQGIGPPGPPGMPPPQVPHNVPQGVPQSVPGVPPQGVPPGVPPRPPQGMPQGVPPNIPRALPPGMEEGMSPELMHKVMQQQQMLEIEKIREQVIHFDRPHQPMVMMENQQSGPGPNQGMPHPNQMSQPGPAPIQPPPPVSQPGPPPQGQMPPHPMGMPSSSPAGPPGVPPQGIPPQGIPPHPPQGPPQQGVRPPPMMGGPPGSQQPPPQHGGPPPQHGGPPPQHGGPPPQHGGPPPRLPPPQLDDKQSMTPMEQRPPQPLPKEIRLPQALEKVLEFKTVRAQEVGVTPEELEHLDKPDDDDDDQDYDDDEDERQDLEADVDEEEEEEEVKEAPSKSAKESKNKRRKKKKKKAKRSRLQEQKLQKRIEQDSEKRDEEHVHIEYVQEQLDLDPMDPNYHTFAMIFDAFKISEPEKPKELPRAEEKKPEQKQPEKMVPKMDDSDSDSDDEDAPPEEETPKLSKKKMKKLTRLSVAQLKQLVTRPDVVEMQDVTARDPRLLVHLKATRNTVPVPRHWSYKRKYLQGKRGIEKPPFELPDFIKATGIQEMRAALAEKEDQKTLKAKMRERVRPKMGKIDIDYQKLHDAFFRFQTKPKMTIHGDLYYEGKEFETRLKEKKPGNLSDDLKVALGMPVGANSDKVPPPWLIAMQRYGPPPSYPNLKIPGLNAPIPEGCSFGYHAGGWGKPPVDENGKPLYGDVFGTQGGEFPAPIEEEEIDKSHWGELESESESEEESEEESDEDDQTGLVTPAEGLVTPSGMTSVPIGVETPEMIELRKRRIEDAMDQGGDTPALYTVLPEKKTAVGGAMMGSAHVYDMTGVTAKKVGDKVPTEGIEVSLNPEELDLDTAAMQAKYDQTVREQQSQLEKEDLSDMVAEHAAKQKKRKKQQQDSGKSAKKYKEFKF